MTELEHIFFCVRELARAVAFYRDVVGLDLVGELLDGRAAMLSSGRTHHGLLLIKVGDAPRPLTGRRIGLYHVVFRVEESLEELRAARNRVHANGHVLSGQSDHTVSQSLYRLDPDGNKVEVYVDDPSFDWRRDRSWLDAPVKPIKLD